VYGDRPRHAAAPPCSLPAFSGQSVIKNKRCAGDRSAGHGRGSAKGNTAVTLISMPQWPPFKPDHYPQGMPAELLELLPSLHAACVVVTSAAYEHEMFRAFGRDEAFLRKVNGTDVAPAIGVLRTCISDSLVLSLAMLFKSDPKAVNLRHLPNTLCRPEYTAFFAAAHRRCNPPLDTEHQRGRLIRMQRRINRDPLRGCIQRIEGLRDQGVAHLDRAPKPGFEWPLMRDMSMAFAAAANITVTALHYMTWRRFNARASRTHGIMLTRAFTQAISPALANRSPVPDPST
jgi:hypothetical protein